MIINGPDMGWFDIYQVTLFDTNEVTAHNEEYIDKSYTIVIQMFNQKHPCNIMVDNISELKRYFSLC